MIKGGWRNPGLGIPCNSLPQMPHASTSTMTSPSLVTGSSTSNSSRVLGLVYTIARIIRPPCSDKELSIGTAR